MTVVLVASGSLGATMPSMVALNASVLLGLQGALAGLLKVSADLDLDLPSLKSELDVAVDLSASLKANLALDPTATIAASLAFGADAQLALAAGLTGPSLSLELAASLDAQLGVVADLSVKLSAKAALLADLKLKIGILRAALDLAIGFQGTLSAGASMRLYLYKGTLLNLSAELSALFAADVTLNLQAPVVIPLLVANAGAEATALTAVFGAGVA